MLQSIRSAQQLRGARRRRNGPGERAKSSAALAANASGFVLHRAPELASLTPAPKRPRTQSAQLSPSSKRTRLASRHGNSERSSGGSSSVGRRAGRLEVELRRMRALSWRREVDRPRFLPQ